MRQTALEIDLGLLRKNYLSLLSKAPGAELIALLKADAYGHSCKEVARALEKLPPKNRPHAFAVANVEEGIELRRYGVKSTIYVFSGVQYYDRDLHRCLRTVDLIPVVSSLAVLRQMAKTLKDLNEETHVHLKFNSGMNRLGLDPQEIEECIQILANTPQIHVEGLMSHLAAGEKPRSPSAKNQVKVFREIVERFRSEKINPKHIHLENSWGFASKLFPERSLARVGIDLYGIGHEGLNPVARWTAQIYQLREIQKGESVGYGPRFQAKKKMRMAVLGVGYADGYRRLYSNRAEVLVRGRRCPVIGSISMDLTAIDVSGVASVSTSDRAVLLGKDGKECITADELARHGESISYEVLTGISPRVPRIFVNG